MIPLIFIVALAHVESGFNPTAVGDAGRSIGALQLGSLVVDDVNQHYGTTYVWPEDAYDYVISIDICRKYLSMWAERNRLNPESDTYLTDLAGIWNGGPQGHRKDSTLPFRRKVIRTMNRLENLNHYDNEPNRTPVRVR